MSARHIVLVSSEAEEDLRGCEELTKHLRCQEKLEIDVWHRGRAEAGTDAYAELKRRAGAAELVVFLMSADLASDSRWATLRDELGGPAHRFCRINWRACSPGRLGGIPAVADADGPVSSGADREAALQRIAEELALRLTRRRHHGLPLPPRSVCAIYERELEEIAHKLGPSPVAVLGPPGIGKSVLAARAVHAALDRAGSVHAACFVDCEGATSVEGIVSLLAEELEMPSGVSNRQRWLSEKVRDRVVVLDGADRAWESSRPQVEKALQELERDSAGQMILTLRGHASPRGWARVMMAPLKDAQPQEMFLSLLGEKAGRFRSDRYLADLLQVTGGYPFALELLARRVQYEPDLSSVWADWRKRGGSSLGDLDPFMADALRSTRLTEGARALLVVLAWLPGGLLVSDVEVVMAPHGREVISPLRETALIQEEDDRLQLLSPWRDYLQRQPEREDGRRRSRCHVFALVHDQGSKVGAADGAVATQRLRGELANLLFLTDDGLQQEAEPEALEAARAALALVPLLRFSGLGDATLLPRAEAVARRHGQAELALHCRLGLADVTLAQGDYGAADAAYEGALALCAHDPARAVQRARALIGRGRVAAYRCNADQAEACYREALTLSTEGREEEGIAQARKYLAQAASERGAADEAIAHYQASLGLFSALGDQREAANCQRSLAAQHLHADPSEHGRTRARPLLDQALSTLRDSGDLRGQADCLRILADLMQRDAQHATAEEQVQRALGLYEEIHDARGQAMSWYALGRLSEETQQRDAAYTRYQRALDLLNRTDSFGTLVDVFGALARVAPDPQQRSEFAQRERDTQEKLAAQRVARRGGRSSA